MPKEIPSSTNLADSTPSPFLLVGFHPSNHLHPNRPIQCFSQALEDRNGGAYMAPEAQGPGHLPTCSACSSARWPSATANDSVLFCCTPAFTESRLFMLSRSWACCRAMVLGRRHRKPRQSRDTGCPQPHPSYLGWKQEEAGSGFRGAAASQSQFSCPRDEESRKASWMCSPKENVVVTAQLGAPSSRPPHCL